MNTLEFTLLLGTAAVLAGLLGSLSGLGGGVVIIPVLALGFKVDLRYAIGTALVSVIATSSGAAAAYVKEGFSNLRVGMFLEVATTIGAVIGAYLAALVAPAGIAVIFGLVLLWSAYLTVRPRQEQPGADRADLLATWLRLDSGYPTPEGLKSYHVHGVPLGFLLMFVAGALSGLLGIGSGAIKVLAMDQAMRLPFKVSTTTSNFMIGVTAAASAGIYLHRGYIVPGLAMPVLLGVLVGSTLGTYVLVRVQTKVLRYVFSAVIVALGIQMMVEAFTGGFPR
jgi:hypothetical protein